MSELNGRIKQLETLKAEITKLKVDNVEKEIKLKEVKKMGKKEWQTKNWKWKLNKDNEILKERLTTIEDKNMFIQSYQCDKCNSKSEDRNKI